MDQSKAPIGVVPVGEKLIQLTRWTATHPVTKEISLAAEGELIKKSTASQLYDGSVERLAVTVAEFSNLLPRLGQNDCLSYGITRADDAARVLSKKRAAGQGLSNGTITRTTEHMQWPSGPAILMVDYDPDEATVLSKQELLDALYTACPTLKNCVHIWWPSTSSCLYHGETGKEIRGIFGQRVYIVVAVGHDIPRAGAVLCKRLWLAGYGHIKISKAGTMLLRTVADGTVWQPNRIDYCTPPSCEAPLESRKPPPELYGDPAFALDTTIGLRDLDGAEEAAFEKLVEAAKQSIAEQARGVRNKYLDKKIGDLVANGVSPAEATRIINQAVEGATLVGDFTLFATTGETVTIKQLLNDPVKWHGASFADPLDPDYHDDNRIARAYLLGVARPYIFSFAHGGMRYFLAREAVTLLIAKGQRGSYLEQAAKHLSESEAAFLRGTSLVEIDDAGDIHLLTELGVLKLLDHTIRFAIMTARGPAPVDALPKWAQLLAGPYATSFKPLKAVLSAPIIDPNTGHILTQPGYHPAQQMYMTNAENFCEVPLAHSIEQVEEALATLWWPVRRFPFVAPADQSVMLASMLTMVIRPMLGTVPAFAFDAPVQGSGKTLLIKFLCVLAGEVPTMSPPPDSGNDEEMRKRLFACLREGDKVIVIDNLVGAFDSPALASMITSDRYKDRILRESRTEEVPNCATVLLSGNNLSLKGDLPRRVFVCRIDPKIELPHQRTFDFDPEQVGMQFRQELVASALTLIRAFLARPDESARPAPGRFASFEQWDDVVRQTVCWLGDLQAANQIPTGSEIGSDYPVVVDPMEAINEVVRHDPVRERHGHLLHEIAQRFGAGNGHGNQFSTRQLVAEADPFTCARIGGIHAVDDEVANLYDLLVEVAGDAVQRKINNRSLGSYFSKHKDRIVGGLCLRSAGTRQNTAIWHIEDIDGILGGLRGFGGSNCTYAGTPSDSKTKSPSMPMRPPKPTAPTNSVKLKTSRMQGKAK